MHVDKALIEINGRGRSSDLLGTAIHCAGYAWPAEVAAVEEAYGRAQTPGDWLVNPHLGGAAP